MERAVEVVVTGRVQGVSFRAYTQREAQRSGVTGWVCNEPDGSVAVHAEGPDEAVGALVAWLRHGPRFAAVDRVEVRETSPTSATSFEVRY